MTAAGGCICGYVVRARPTFALDSLTPALAEPGDFHVCPCCATILILDGELWRPATLTEVVRAEPETQATLAAVSKAAVREIRRMPGRGFGGMVN